MIGAQKDAETGVWRIEGHSIAIEYSATVLEQIRQAAEDGFNRLGHGGIEIGGVLFGTHSGDTVNILAFRSLEIEYAFGPSFVLSEKDCGALTHLLEQASSDPELRRFEPVGWYHSHTRSELSLAGRDLEFYNRFFPESWQIALVLRPARGKLTRAGFFFREPNGSIRESSYAEFTIEPMRSRVRLPSRAGGGAGRARNQSEMGRSFTDSALALSPHTSPTLSMEESVRGKPATSIFSEEAPPARRRWPWIAALSALIILGIGAVMWQMQWRNPLALQGMALQVTDIDGQLRIEWDRLSGPILEATGGSLDILDGSDRVQLFFEGSRLREGSVTYARHSDQVEVRLRVDRVGAPPVEETVQFLGTPVSPANAQEPKLLAQNQPEIGQPGRSPASPTPIQPKPAPSPSREEAREPAPAPVVPAKAVPGAKDLPAITVPKPAVPAAGTNTSPTPAPKPAPASAAPRVETRPPVPAPTRIFAEQTPAGRQEPSKDQPLAQPPVHVTQTAPLAASPAPAPAAAGRQEIPSPPQPAREPVRNEPQPGSSAPAAPKAAAEAKVAYTGPSSGRIIWAGQMARGMQVNINGRRASAGSVTAELPGVPVRIRAYPADLSSRGMTVFTSNASQARITEAPGPSNGWNRTTYTLDPRRANEVVVLESPSAQNNWKGLTLRSERDNLSLVIIEWQINK